MGGKPEDIPKDVWEAAMKVAVEMEIHAALSTTTAAKADVIARAIMAATAAGKAGAIGAVDTLRESLMEGLMTDAGLAEADRVAMNFQLAALDAAADAIRKRGEG